MLLILVPVGLAAFVLLRVHIYSDIRLNTSAVEKKHFGTPARIKIPRIQVDAVVEQVSTTPEGLMGVPTLPQNTAWYQAGPRPGEIGSAVIDGHVNWKNGASAVFANLHKLKPGDTIYIQDDQGSVISFAVIKSQLFTSTANDAEVFLSIDKRSHLNLITCDGVWQQSSGEYSQRLVIFADRE